MGIGKFFDKIAGAKRPLPVERKHAGPPSIRVPEMASMRSLPVTKAVLSLAVVSGSFYLGAAYQRSHQPAATTLGSNGSSMQSQGGISGGTGGNLSPNGLSGGGGFGRFGRTSLSTEQVTAISSTSITVKDSAGNSQTYAITSNTIIADSSNQVSTSNVQTGDTVIVIPARDDTSTARRVIVNPDLGNQPTTIDPGQTQLN